MKCQSPAGPPMPTYDGLNLSGESLGCPRCGDTDPERGNGSGGKSSTCIPPSSMDL